MAEEKDPVHEKFKKDLDELLEGFLNSVDSLRSVALKGAERALKAVDDMLEQKDEPIRNVTPCLSFTLSEKEQKAFEDWVAKQRKLRPEPRTAIGGAVTYSFTPTSIGIVVTVEYLGEKKDITDYDLW